jgi:protein-disulfide isomerase
MNKLTSPVSDRDHRQGPLDAPVVMVEYGDYECPHCKAAASNVNMTLAELGDRICFVYRHFPLIEIHPQAELAAEAAESAGAQNRFWQMHDKLFQYSPALDELHVMKYAHSVKLNMDRFSQDLMTHRHLPRVVADMESGVQSGVQGTPTFFINGIRHRGGYDLASLIDAVRVVH